MAGKGKSKAKGKSKTKASLKKFQIEMGDRIIDLTRFAYDVFVHSSSKFGIPEKCISKWEGGENDYLYSNFMLVLSRQTFKYQIKNRYRLNGLFKTSCQSANLGKFQGVQSLLRAAIGASVETMEGPGKSFLQHVVVSLSVISELILFLYSKNNELYWQELARYWFQYFNPMKKSFEKAGGFARIYERSNMTKHDTWDVFFDKFIPEFCIPYESKCVVGLAATYYEETQKFYRDIEANLSNRDREEISYRMSKEKPAAVSQPKSAFRLPPVASGRDEASASGLPLNTGLGIVPHEQLYSDGGATSAPSLPSISDQKATRDRRRPPGKKGGQKDVSEPISQASLPPITSEKGETSDSDSGIPMNTGLGIPPHETFYGASASRADHTPSPQGLPRISGQKATGDRRGLPSKKEGQKDVSQPISQANLPPITSEEDESSDSDSGIPMNTGLGIPPHETLYGGAGTSRAGDTQSTQDLPSTSSQRPKRDRRRLHTEKEVQKKSSLPPGVEGNLKQLNLGDS